MNDVELDNRLRDALQSRSEPHVSGLAERAIRRVAGAEMVRAQRIAVLRRSRWWHQLSTTLTVLVVGGVLLLGSRVWIRNAMSTSAATPSSLSTSSIESTTSDELLVGWLLLALLISAGGIATHAVLNDASLEVIISQQFT